MHSERLAQAQTMTKAAEVDGLLITPGPTLRYLTGYDAIPLERLTCLVIPSGGGLNLVVPNLEVAAAKASPVGDLDVTIRGWGETDDPFALVASMLPSDGVVGLDDQMTAAKVLALRRALPRVEQTLAGPVLRDLRLIKSRDEITDLRRAAEAIDRVHGRMGEWLMAGRTEREVGDDIAEAILDEGHERVDFVIVASGPNGASPHHEVDDRMIERGDPVVVDIGGTMPSGYCSDSTRTYCIDHAPEDFREYYTVLQRAQEAATGHVRPGVSAESVDAAARAIIEDGGYGENFIHRTGHGIGLETHEDPYIVSGNDEPLRQGMVFSVEPGIYLPGRHGARIEDIVVVTDEGVESLNEMPRDLTIIDTSYSS